MEEPKNKKRILSGRVISDKMNQTAVVLITRLARHPKYKKTYKVSKKYKVDNPANTYKMGEDVFIEETRPLSKEKRWRILRKVSELS